MMTEKPDELKTNGVPNLKNKYVIRLSDFSDFQLHP